MSKDLTLLLEDRPGSLAKVGEALGKAGINDVDDAIDRQRRLGNIGRDDDLARTNVGYFFANDQHTQARTLRAPGASSSIGTHRASKRCSGEWLGACSSSCAR